MRITRPNVERLIFAVPMAVAVAIGGSDGASAQQPGTELSGRQAVENNQVQENQAEPEAIAGLSVEAAKLYAAIVPKPDEVKWRQIPWLIDLEQGIELARQENRPLMIWTSQQSHPLERC